MKQPQNSKNHILLLFCALILAFSFRLIRLGAMPLFDAEAEIALEALSIAEGASSTGASARGGAFPALVGLTGLDFAILKPSNFLARFWGAAISSLIVIIPFLFRERLGYWGATIAAFLLAISPELVGPSRLIGTPVMAAVCLLLGLGFLFQRKPILAGVFTSLGLMSGPGFWFGVVILGASVLVSELMFGFSKLLQPTSTTNMTSFWLRFGLSSALGILVIGTGFFMAPQGLNGVFSGLIQFVVGIFQKSILSFNWRVLGLVAYAGGAVVFGLWGGIRGTILRNKFDMFLLIWSGFGLIFYLFYPASQPSYLVWVTLPLWILTARAFSFGWRFPRYSRLLVVGTALLVIVVSAFMLLALRRLVQPGLPQGQQLNTLIALVGGMILLVAVVFLINYGWAEEIAQAGLLLGLAAVLSLGLVAASVNFTSLSPETSNELWLAGDPPITSKWLKISIDRVISWNRKGIDPIDIAVADFETPAMVWVLSAYEAVDFVPYLAPQSRPGILITDLLVSPEISSAYRGQDLVWSREILWNKMTPFQYLEWLITRTAPALDHEIILWVRTDLMPDEQFAP
jgi:hypothetical protein